MATLADLFVTYKSVIPEKEETKTAKLATLSPDLVKSRFQQLEESRQEHQRYEEEAEDSIGNADDDDSEENYEDLEENEEINDLSYPWYVMDANSPTIEYGIPDATAAIYNFRPSGMITKYNRGHLQEELENLFSKYGIKARVTSGKRPAGAAGNTGNNSHHVYGNAADIVPRTGVTFDTLKRQLLQTPEILQFFYENGLGVIDETDPAIMAKTKARGKHFHIGPDRLGLTTWKRWLNEPLPEETPATSVPYSRENWTREVYNAFKEGLEDEYGHSYSDNTYKRIAAFITYQLALESGYGQGITDFNYGGHKRGGQRIKYDSLDDFVKAHIKTLSKWKFMEAKSLKDFVNSLYQGQYKYNTSDTPQAYYNKINGTTNRINRYLGLSMQFGGKFTDIRQYYEKITG